MNVEKYLLEPQVKLIKIQVRSHFPLKDRYMLMLLHINEDFDDDLLQEAIELLDNRIDTD